MKAIQSAFLRSFLVQHKKLVSNQERGNCTSNDPKKRYGDACDDEEAKMECRNNAKRRIQFDHWCK